MPEETLPAKVAGMRKGLEALQAEDHLAKLQRDLVKLEDKASKRNPERTLAIHQTRMAALIEQSAAASDDSDPGAPAAPDRRALPRPDSGITPPRRRHT